MTKAKENPILAFIQKNRHRLENLQEASFERGEKQLEELLGDEIIKDQFPVPGFALEILVWMFILLFPMILIADPTSQENGFLNIQRLAFYYLPLVSTILIFGLNQRIFVPRFFFKKRYFRYFAWNGMLLLFALLLREAVHYFFESGTNKSITDFFGTYCFSTIRGHFGPLTILMFVIIESLVCFCCITFNILSRQIVRAFIIREKGRANLQYELDFLKNQLSPHFLFNTLNNISALIRIDPQKAEDSMAKLSKLLRITLYQTSDKTISIQEEIDILQKYAELEKLRLDDSYELSFNIDIENKDFPIAPLISMPLVENAIKHSIGIGDRNFAHISISQKGNNIVFLIENSNHPRKASPKAGGLGLSTLKKRLELLYGGKYSYETFINDSTYKVKLQIDIVQQPLINV